MGNCSTCPSASTCGTKGTENSCEQAKTMPKYGNVKKIIGVISGKGGVGKSTVTGILALELARAGYKVGVLDGDITGPSMPRFFGISNERCRMEAGAQEHEVKFIPIETQSGVKVVSMNLLTKDEEQPVIWRGPVITGVLNQMYVDTQWGDLDYLLIDMPPGTGDIALTVMQSLPVDGMVVVSTPQDMVTMIVKKVVIMAEKMEVKVIGVVENMSYVKCPGCDEKIKIFSKKTGAEQAEALGVPLIAELPIDLDLVESLEEGTVEYYVSQSQDYKGIIDLLVASK